MPTPINQRKILGPRLKAFDPSAPLFVRVPFDSYKAGDPFTAKVDRMRLSGLFGSRYITHERPGAAPEPQAAEKPPKRPRAGA